MNFIPEEEEEKYRAYFKNHALEGTGLQEEIIVDNKGNQIPVIVSTTILDLERKAVYDGNIS